MLSNDYSYDNQCSIFDFLGTDDNNEIQINKDIYLIEMFAGYGSQALGFKRLNVPIKHHFVCEFDKYAVNSYNSFAIHNTCELLRSLDSGVEVEFDGNYTHFNDTIMDVMEAIDGTLEYELDYSENNKEGLK